MPRFRCDFEVRSDLALPAAEPEIRAHLPSGHEVVIWNDTVDASGNVSGLVCSVIGEANDIDTVHSDFREIIARYLDVLTFATQSGFFIRKVRRLMDWEPGQQDRRMKMFETFAGTYPPERGLTSEYLATVSELESAGIDDFARVALKYFRYGFLERSPEDQFMRFWLALEVIAENQKPTEKTSIPCAECGEAMKCAHCGCEPLRRPMATDAIRTVIANITGDMARAVSKRQLAARNSIMHGRSIESLEAECKMPIDQILNELARVTHSAIANVIPLPSDGAPLVFGYREDITAKELTVSMVGGFRHHGDTPHPSEDRLPAVQISILPGD